MRGSFFYIYCPVLKIVDRKGWNHAEGKVSLLSQAATRR